MNLGGDPHIANQIVQLIEGGYDPQQIAQKLIEDSKPKTFEKEIFSDKIMIASQPLAFRDAVESDLKQIHIILTLAYTPEVNGAESFRSGEVVRLETIQSLYEDKSYRWIVVEVPDGRGIENDGSIIGACCFSIDGTSRRNGVVEGKLGSIRYFGLLPQYHGVLIGQRMLTKIERIIQESGCCRVMACIPESRKYLVSWLSRRGYDNVKTMPYPSEMLSHSMTRKIDLFIFVKMLKTSEVNSEEDVQNRLPVPPSSSNKMMLPPHWRSIHKQDEDSNM